MNSPSRREAVQMAQLLRQSRPIFFDTETTGISPTSEVVEIAVVDWDGELLFDSLVKPRGRIDPEAARIHGITERMVELAPGWNQVWSEVARVFKDRKVGAYNSDFDLRILRQTNLRSGVSWPLTDDQFFCVMKLYARFAGNWDSRRGAFRWHSLDTAGRQCGIPLPNSHRAKDDALLAWAVFEHILNWGV